MSLFELAVRSIGVGRGRHVLLGALWIACLAAAPAANAAVQSLDGEWQMLPAAASDYPPSEAGWLPATVPGCLFGAGEGGVWIRRNFEMGSPLSQRQLLRFWGIYFEPRVWVNGQQVWDGAVEVNLPWDLDITSAAVAGNNEVLIWMRDWSATHHTKIPLTGLAVNQDPRTRVTDKIIDPLPPDFLCFGLLDSVVLRTVAMVRVDDILVESTLSLGNTGTAKIQPSLFNAGTEPEQVRIEGVVMDASGTSVASFAQDAVWLYPGSQRIVLPVTSGINHPWTSDDPYLYRVRVELKQVGQTVHSMEAQFGFRQIVASDKLALNGLPVVGSMEELWPRPEYYQTGRAQEEMELLKQRRINVVALMGGRWPQAWYQAADQLGILVFASSNLDCDSWGAYKYTLQAFTDSAKRDVGNVLRLVALHPSVVGVAVARRLVSCGAAFPLTDVKRRELVETLMAYARELEDSRPLFTPGDLDGTGDPDSDWLILEQTLADRPAAPRWLTLFTEGLELPGTPGLWKWDQTKPLFVSGIGIPDADPQAASALLGPDGKYAQARSVALAGEFFKRVREVLWLKGATLVAPEIRRPDRLSFQLPGRIPDWGTGRPIEWVYRTVGDHFLAQQSRPLRWDVVATGVGRLTGAILRIRGPQGDVLVERGINLAPGETTTLDVMVKAPSVPLGQPSAEFSILLEVEYQGQTETRTQVFRAYPEGTLPRLPDSVTVLDPLGTLPAEIAPASGGVPVEGFTDLLDAGRLVVVGPGAFKSLVSTPVAKRVYQDVEQLLLYYVETGGTLVVFKQESYEGILPFQVLPGAPRVLRGLPGHPVTEGLEAQDLDGWKSTDGLVGDSVIVPPLWGAFRCLVSAPSSASAQGCVVAEVLRGQGTLLLVQLDLGPLLAQEPVAKVLLGRLVEYAATHSGTLRVSPRVAATESALSMVLQALGVPGLPAEMAQECAEVLVQPVATALTDSVLSGLGKQYPAMKLAWLVLTNLGQAAQLTPWKTAGLSQAPTLALPLVPTQKQRREMADQFYESLFPVAGLPDLAAGFVPGADVVQTFGPQDLSGAEGCIGPGEEVWITLEEAAGIPIRVDLVADVSSPLTDPVVVSLSGEQTQAVVLVPGDDVQATAVLPLGVALDGVLRIRNESQVLDVLTGHAASVCITSLAAGSVAEMPEAQLDTLPALWMRTSAWGYPMVLDGAGRWDVAGGNIGGLGLISRFLADQAVPVDTPIGITLPASQFDVVDSQLHGLEDDGLYWLRDNGSLTTTLEFPANGPYRILVAGKGRPANNIYPAPEILVDGKLAGTFTFSGHVDTFYADAQVEKGTHTVSVAFVNDAFLPPEDRDAGFAWVSVVALRANFPPVAGIHSVTTPAGLELSPSCAWDPDGDEVSYVWSWSAQDCFVQPDGTSDQAEHSVDLPYGSYWVTLEAKDSRGAVTRRCEQIFHDGSQLIEAVEAVEPLPDVVEETVEPDSAQPEFDFQVGDDVQVAEPAAPKKKSDGCSLGSSNSTSSYGSTLMLLLAALLGLSIRRRNS